MIPRSKLALNMYPAHSGPRDRNSPEVVCPIPWIMPSTDGSGAQLLSSIMVAGSTNMRPVVWITRTKLIESHSIVELLIGMIDRNSAST